MTRPRRSTTRFSARRAEKTLVKNLVFDNTLEGFQKLLASVERIKVPYSLTTVVFGIEPTASYHEPLAEHLIKCGHLVVLVGGVAVKNNRQFLDGRWNKHDVKDAANVADLNNESTDSRERKS